MSEEHNEIINTIHQIYLNNLNFLEKEFPDVYEKVIILHDAISTNKYEQKYELEFDETSGSFNIRDLKNDTYLYDGNSYEISDKITEDLTLDKESGSSLLTINHNTQKLSETYLVQDLWPLIKVINKEVDFNKYRFTKLYKYMFIGTGLGLHIDYINRKFSPNNILIVEPNIELFRLSLFITDYSDMLSDNKKLFLSIAEDRADRLRTVKKFFAHQPYLNYFIKHTLLNDEYTNLLNDIASYLRSNHSSRFSYKVQFLGLKRTIKYAKDKYNFLQIAPFFKSKRFKDKKILVISAGPSTKKRIDWIVENQNKFYIIAVDTIVPFLSQYKVKMDMIVTIDPSEIVKIHFEQDHVKRHISKTPVIMPSQVSDTVLNELNKENVFIFQAYNTFVKLGVFMSASNVGTYALHLAVLLGTKQIYLLGNDAAFDQDSGTVYSDNQSGNTNIEMDRHNESQLIDTYGSLLKVKGNLREWVSTTEKLMDYKDDYESSIKYIKNEFDCNVYNLSDGVFIEQIEPLSPKEFDAQNPKNIRKQNLLKFFISNSKKVDEYDFSEDIEHLEEIVLLYKKFKRNKIKDRNDLIYKQLELLVKTLEWSKKMSIAIFGTLFLEFLELSGIYFYFYLNVEGKHLNDKQKLEKIKIEWCNVAIKLLNEMIEVEK